MDIENIKKEINYFINSNTNLFGWKHLIHRTRFASVIKIIDPKPNEKIIDVGCAQGQYTYEIAKRGSDTTGVDILTQKKPDYRLSIPFIEASIYELPFKDNSIDKAFLSEMIIALDEPVRGLKEINRVLKENGKLILSNSPGYETFDLFFQKDTKYPFLKKMVSKITKNDSEDEFIKIHDELKEYLGVNPKNEKNFSIEKTKKLLEQSGFKLVNIHYEFKQKASTLMAFLIIFKYLIGKHKNKKAFSWTFWWMYPIFKLLETIDNKPGSGILYECIKEKR